MMRKRSTSAALLVAASKTRVVAYRVRCVVSCAPSVREVFRQCDELLQR